MNLSLNTVIDHNGMSAAEIHRLETSLRTAQEHYSSLRTQQLRKDFRYNSDVLAERDEELRRYELLTPSDSNSQSILEFIEQQVQLKKEATEDIQKKALPGVHKNTTYVDVKRAERFPDENHKEQLKEVHKAISKLQRDLDTLSAQASSMKTQHQEQLQEREDIIERYKKELSRSLKREKHLEQRMVQQELEWQKNCGDIQSKHYLDHERLIQELTTMRENVNAELIETKMQLQELTVLLQCVTKERDLAIQGCVPDTNLLASHEMTALKQQNCRLQAVVSEMRKQMEELSCTTPPHHTELENRENKEVDIPKKEQLEPNIIKGNEKVH
ncbi:coiled-coil domain-containing protein 57 [Eucyclogobius newberryi]|uniref:coiled-coil domain-containing protein 57 n=1 Tax=Eucyclogobius newberryi TaxID=166745 RepID=UPI003B5C509C